MYCTKCGTKNEDNNIFCKNCGAKLVKPSGNSPVNSIPYSQSTSSGSGAAKLLKAKLIAGIAAALVIIVMAAGILLKNGINNGNSLFEQIKLGKTTAADVKKYLDKNNLDYDWGCEDTPIGDYLFIMTPESNFFFEKPYFSGYFDGYGNMKQYAYGEATIRNTLSDTLWGAECEYFTTVDIDNSAKDKKREVLCTSCVVTVEGKSEEREFRQKLNEYIKKHQKTDLKKLEDIIHEDTVLYPLEITKLNGSKVLICLYCDFHYLENDRKILLTLYAENYFSDKEVDKILEEYTPAYGDILWDIDDRFLFEGKIAGIYGGCDLNDRYIQYKKDELKAINKETPDFTCRIDYTEGGMEFPEFERIVDYSIGYIDWINYKPDVLQGEKYIMIEKCDSDKSDITIPESIHGYPVKGIADDAFSDCTNLKSIKIPDSVTDIGSNAFSGCSSLTEIELPSGVTEIKDNTFSGCSSLTDVKIPNSVTTIGDKAFENCSSLVNINIDNNITVIADNAFNGCDILVCEELNVRFPNVVPKPAWLEAYREFEKDRNCNCINFVDGHSSGVPYLVEYGSYLYHYNGIEVENTFSAINMEFNSVSNKAMADSHIVLDGVTGLDFYLVDLSTGSIELSCTEIWHHDGSPSEYFDSDDNKISEEEYNRISNEMNNLFGSGGYWLEQNYPSVDEAYQAYMSNRGSISTSNSTSATNVFESTDTALAADASASDNTINIDVETEVKQIRQ